MISSYKRYRLRSAAYSALALITRKRCLGFPIIRKQIEDKCGLEIGGPSSIFSANHLIPIYDHARRIDNCNFAQQTIWTSADDQLRFGRRFGKQIIADACDIGSITDESYDFVVASHVLEHIANPLRALNSWKRVLKSMGTILVVLPHKSGTFDHRRPLTTLEHLRQDFESNIDEADLTHLPEVVRLHDLEFDPPAGSLEQFQRRCADNISHRAMHHHVFSPELLVEVFSFLEMKILSIAVERPYHIIVFARTVGSNQGIPVESQNCNFLDLNASWRRKDPFQRTSSSKSLLHK